jgi:putative hydrolase of the HAD superfamily
MHIRAVLFDVNGTLVEILTEDHADEVYRAAGHYLTYQGVDLRRGELRELYLAAMKQQRRASPEEHPEFDAVALWRGILDRHAGDFTRALPTAKREQVPLALAELTRAVARRRLRLYPAVRSVLQQLRARFPLAVVTDAQSAWARGELAQVGLLDYFDPIVVSGDHGFRKPDPRLFSIALDALGVAPQEAVYVGNDMYRDIYGARRLGMTTVMFDSDQGTKQHEDVVPDHTITDHRELLAILGVDGGGAAQPAASFAVPPEPSPRALPEPVPTLPPDTPRTAPRGDAMMTKKAAAEAVLAAKIRLGLTWAQIADAVDAPLAWTTAALLGQHPMTATQAATAAGLLELDADAQVALQLQPTRGALDSPVPTDPTIYRFYEVLQVYGPTIKELIHEQCGDGIMSAINFRLDVSRVPDPAGDRVRVVLDGKFLPYQW